MCQILEQLYKPVRFEDKNTSDEMNGNAIHQHIHNKNTRSNKEDSTLQVHRFPLLDRNFTGDSYWQRLASSSIKLLNEEILTKGEKSLMKSFKVIIFTM